MGDKAFAFGKNWQLFLKRYLNQSRIDEAKRSLVEFCGANMLEGKSFLDIGCGSGLFSFAAYKLGVSKILSFDFDIDSVASCNHIREREKDHSRWQVMQGSILDDNFVSGIGKYDFVYAWGVLHHTGNMWKAIENALKLVADNGMLYLAIYNKADGLCLYPDGRFGSSGFWLRIKKIYSSIPRFFQDIIDYSIMAVLVVSYLLRFKNPVKEISDYDKLRGMSWRVDIRDWMGGYPYEYASAEEIFNFIKKRGFSLERLKCNNGLRNNEYLFKKIQ